MVGVLRVRAAIVAEGIDGVSEYDCNVYEGNAADVLDHQSGVDPTGVECGKRFEWALLVRSGHVPLVLPHDDLSRLSEN